MDRELDLSRETNSCFRNKKDRTERSHRSSNRPTNTTRSRVEVLLTKPKPGQTGKRTVPSGIPGHPPLAIQLFRPLEFRATRKPLLLLLLLLLRFDGLFLFRFADRQFAASLFQLPPRFTRFEPLRFVHPRRF